MRGLRIFGRVIGALIIVVVASVVTKLVLAVLGVALPGPVRALLGEGWGQLYGYILPGLGALIALLLLWFFYWLAIGGSRR